MRFLEIRNLSFEYNEKIKALKDVSFDVEQGDFLCILGRNGSGKSTLAKLIMGLQIATSGSISINGIQLTVETVEEIRTQLGIVFQNPDNQFVGITVKDDIAFGLENRNISHKEMLERINEYAQLVGVEHLLERDPSSLSGGEKQKVAIASVLACEPEMIIFDESTSMLDPKSTKELLKTIKKLKGKKTIIYITHKLNEAFMADKILVFNQGEIVGSGKALDILKAKEILEKAGLETCGYFEMIDRVQNEQLNQQKEVLDVLWELVYQQ